MDVSWKRIKDVFLNDSLPVFFTILLFIGIIMLAFSIIFLDNLFMIIFEDFIFSLRIILFLFFIVVGIGFMGGNIIEH